MKMSLRELKSLFTSNFIYHECRKENLDVFNLNGNKQGLNTLRVEKSPKHYLRLQTYPIDINANGV